MTVIASGLETPQLQSSPRFFSSSLRRTKAAEKDLGRLSIVKALQVTVSCICQHTKFSFRGHVNARVTGRKVAWPVRGQRMPFCAARVCPAGKACDEVQDT